MFELTYGLASKADVSAIFQQCKDLIDAYEDVDSIDYPRVIAWVENKIQENISAYTCVQYNGETVGYYSLTEQDAGYELDDFYILPPYRNLGIGSKVLEHCLLMTDGPVYLYVFTGNAGAVRLYEKFGFQISERVGRTRMIMRRDG